MGQAVCDVLSVVMCMHMCKGAGPERTKPAESILSQPVDERTLVEPGMQFKVAG